MIRKKGVLRILAAFFVCAAVMLSAFPVAAKAVAVYVWDGKTELQPGRIYYITDTVRVHKAVTIPAGTKLSVRDGGQLKIQSIGYLTVRGELSVAIGGLIINSGSLSIKPEGTLSVYGQLQSSINGKMYMSGKTNIYNRGIFETSSATKIYKTAEILVKGELDFYKSSDVKLSGEITTVEKSIIQLRGIFAISLSGSIDVSGHLTIGAESNVRCSGTFTLRPDATYTRFKPIIITKSGTFSDGRPTYKYEDMTVDVLIDEPDVELHGIDVSYAQGDSIDWEQVAASGIDFAIIRAGRGYISDEKPMAEDIHFRRNIEEAQKYGIDVGVYFYSYATSVAEARAEAEFYVDIIEGYQIQYPVILDMEESFQGEIGKKKLTNMIDAFFEVLMEHHYFPMFYSYKAWIEQYLDMTTLDKYAVWLAQISDEVTYDGGYYIWQYSFTGKVSGIPNDIDLDISYKNWPEILKKYGLNNLK
ncbi:MAG: glycoside hydrolase family 25 protein [Ruminiclostridium sp.]|nr:glycoside hydrolase family 25 protein [Ruminiclostridium sp.]